MRTLLSVVAVVGGLLSVIVGYFYFATQRWDWNQKLTIEVNTPSGVKTGSSVVHVRREKTPAWLAPVGGGGMGYAISGEATVVEVAPGKYLFALLSGGYADSRQSNSYHAYLPFKVFFPGESTNSVGVANALESLRLSREISPKHYPLLLTFDDVNEPLSVRRVDPEDLEAILGGGITLKRMTLEIVDGEFFEGRVGRVLRWLHQYTDKLLDGRTISTVDAENRMANSLGAGSFDTEIRR